MDSLIELSRPKSASPPPNCAICLGSSPNKCISDSCLHQFCFTCLLEWSKIKAECPLCKKPFKSIRHNIKSSIEYDEHIIENRPVIEIDIDGHVIDNEPFLILPPNPPAHRQFHFRTTFTVDTGGDHAIQQTLHAHPLVNALSISSYTLDRARHQPITVEFRRSLYENNLTSYLPPNVCNVSLRDTSPAYFRNNPNARYRLMPWLNREVMALLNRTPQVVSRVVDEIFYSLMRYHISSQFFQNFLHRVFGERSDHFTIELYTFMTSHLDIHEYDRNALYMEQNATGMQLARMIISDSDNDSDVILVEETSNQNPVVIDLVDTDSDEPILVEETQGARGAGERGRSPVLPLKLRLKKRHSKHSGKKRHREPVSSSSDEHTDDGYRSFKRFKQRRKQLKQDKEYNRRKHTSSRPSTSSSTRIEKQEIPSSSDSEVPLTNYLPKFKKHSQPFDLSSKTKLRSHTITSSDTTNNPCDSRLLSHDLDESSPINLSINSRTKYEDPSPRNFSNHYHSSFSSPPHFSNYEHHSQGPQPYDYSYPFSSNNMSGGGLLNLSQGQSSDFNLGPNSKEFDSEFPTTSNEHFT